MDNSSNDNDAARFNLAEADPHGYAALLLTESLLHSLVDNATINLAEANNIISIAIDATEEITHDLPGRPQSLDRSISLLTDIKRSLGDGE